MKKYRDLIPDNVPGIEPKKIEEKKNLTQIKNPPDHNRKNKKYGILSPEDNDQICDSCCQLLLAVGQDPFFKDTPKERPLFCPECNKWFHTRCSNNEIACPSCNTLLYYTNFYCQRCNKVTMVYVNSKWPNVKCGNCSNSISIVAEENVRFREVALLVLVALVSLIGFLFTIGNDLPNSINIIVGIFTVPIFLPWLIILLAAVLSNTISPILNERSPAAVWYTLTAIEMMEYKKKSILYRLFKIHLFYTIKSIPALIFCILAIAFVYSIVLFSRNK